MSPYPAIHKIWVTTNLNGYLNPPHVGQAFLVQRETMDKKAANIHVRLHMASQAERLTKLTRNVCLPSIAATGASKTAAIKSSIGTMMKTAVAYAPVTDLKISPGYGDSL